MSKFFDRPGLFVAWGIDTGDLSPYPLAQRAADAGFGWIAVEYPSSRWNVMRDACRSRGLKFGVWEVAPTSTANIDLVQPDFWIANVEAYGSYDHLLRTLRAKYPKLPCGVVTNCDFDPHPWIRANVRAIPEAYVVDNPVATPPNMIRRCKEMGYTFAFPALGVYHDFPLARYGDYPWSSDQGYSIYLAEGMSDDDWGTAKYWNRG